MTCKTCEFFKSLKSVSKVAKTGKCLAEPTETTVSEDRAKCRHYMLRENLSDEDAVLLAETL